MRTKKQRLTHNRNVKFPDDLYGALIDLAVEEDRPVSYYVRRAVENYLVARKRFPIVKDKA